MAFASPIRRIRTLLVATTLGVAALAVAPAAHADPESDAKDLFARARDLRTKGDCASAVPLFRKAYTIFPHGLGSLRNVAECEEQIGHFASSRRAWLDVKRALITLPTADAKYDGWEKDANDAAARLQPKVATVYADVLVKSPDGEGPANDQSGVELLVNGENLGTTLVGTPLERDPGTYRIRVQAPDAEAVEQQVTLVAGDNKHIQLRLTRTPKVAGPIVEPPHEPEEDHAGRRTAGWILVGVGGAAVVGGVITLILRGSARSDLDNACNGNIDACPASQADNVNSIHSRGQTMSTLTTILLPVGIVAAGAGVAIVLTSKSSKPATQGRLFVTPAGVAGSF